MTTMERELNEIINKELGPNNLRTAMERADRTQAPPQKLVTAPQASPVARFNPQALVRMAEAMQRVQRLAEELERATDVAEKQLKCIKEIL